MKFLPVLLGLSLLLGALAGCAGDPAPLASSEPRRPIVRVQNLNVSLLETARYAVDTRFGPDRPLTQADLPGLLPTALTNYNTTLSYLLNMSMYPNINATQLNETLEGRALFGLLLTDDGRFHPERPSIMLTCSQHGNEPSGSEACLILIEYFTHGTDELAKKVRSQLNVAINPLANPDGKEKNRRGNYEQVDINRDHMNLATLEGRAIHRLHNMVDPILVLDLHEFGCFRGGFAPGCLPVDQTFQLGAPEGVAESEPNLFALNWELLRHVVQRGNEKTGPGTVGYYMGGTSFAASPSVHRHHFIYRNAVGLLFETGGGTGTVNLPLRVQHQITGTFAAIEWLFTNEARVKETVRNAENEAKARKSGVQGWLVPAQKDSARLEGFLTLHGINYTRLEKETSYQVQDYRGPPALLETRSFPNGTLHIPRWQKDGRLAYLLFEKTDDDHYSKGPRDWGLTAYRILAT